MTMESKTLSLLSISILMLVALMSFSSAKVLTLANTSLIPSSTNPGVDINIPLSVSYNSGSYSNTTLNWSNSNTNIGSFTLPSLNLINNGTTQSTLAVLHVPKYSSGTINALLKVNGRGSSSDSISFSITINNFPSLVISKVNELTRNQNATINVSNQGNTQLTNINLITTTSHDFDVGFNESSFSLSPGEFKIVKAFSSNYSDLNFGQEGKVNIKAVSNEKNSTEVSLGQEVSFCGDVENNADLKIDSLDFQVTKGFGDSDRYWYPLDEVEVDARVKNTGSWDVRDIEIQACLWDNDKKECVLDEGDMKISPSTFDLNSGRRKDIKLTFKVNPRYLNEGSTHYTFYLKAKGQIDDSQSPYDRNDSCFSDYKGDINIRTNEKFIIFDNFNYPETVDAGTFVPISADVWNVGDRVIDKDRVFINVYSRELGINKMIDFSRLNSLDSEPLYINLQIPSNAEEKIYPLTFSVYRTNNTFDNEIYEDSEGDKSQFEIYLNIKNPSLNLPKADVSASLNSSAVAGEPIIINVNVENTGRKQASYNLKVSGADWTSSLSLDKEDFVLLPGEHAEAVLTLKPNKDISGNKTFNLDVYSNNTLVTSQSVSISIEPKKELLWDKIKENPYNWGLGAINVILIIIIIVIAIRVLRK